MSFKYADESSWASVRTSFARRHSIAIGQWSIWRIHCLGERLSTFWPIGRSGVWDDWEKGSQGVKVLRTPNLPDSQSPNLQLTPLQTHPSKNEGEATSFYEATSKSHPPSSPLWRQRLSVSFRSSFLTGSRFTSCFSPLALQSDIRDCGLPMIAHHDRAQPVCRLMLRSSVRRKSTARLLAFRWLTYSFGVRTFCGGSRLGEHSVLET